MKVISIVLNWNNVPDTTETILSLMEQDYENHHILLVDNNSNAEVTETLRKRFDQLEVISNAENLGYTGGNNVGIKYALKKSADIIIIANNDIYIEDNALISKIVNVFENYPNRVHILGPKLMDYFDRNKIQELGTTILKTKNNKYRINNFIQTINQLSDKIKYFDGVSGAFMAVKKEVFERIDLLDENIFMYGDETEFCYRAWTHKFYSAVNEDLIVYHKGGGRVSKKNLPRITYYKTRNTLYFLLKHKQTIKHFWYFLLQFHYFFLSNLWLLIKSKERNKGLISASIKGLTHAWLKRMGERF